ncbi:hypothetical protein J6590_016049 [Homalodisca vitripennis]|nr:hypothetical protein J6590_016049 [Homalodisca vitripennis]
MLQANGDSYNIEDKDEASEALLSKPIGKPCNRNVTCNFPALCPDPNSSLFWEVGADSTNNTWHL